MEERNNVSQGEIYIKLGIMEGKIEAVLVQLADRRTEVNSVFTRLREIESKMAWIMGAIAICGIVIPVFITALGPRIHLGEQPAAVGQPR